MPYQAPLSPYILLLILLIPSTLALCTPPAPFPFPSNVILQCFPRPTQDYHTHTHITYALCRDALSMLTSIEDYKTQQEFGPRAIEDPITWVSGPCHVELGTRNGVGTATFSYEDVYHTVLRIFLLCDPKDPDPPQGEMGGGGFEDTWSGWGGVSDVDEARIWFVQVFGMDVEGG